MNSTPLPIVANVSRIVTQVVDRIAGDRGDYPLLVASACVEALATFQIGSRVFYGQAAWIEILENQQPVWAGCWGENFSFWVVTEHGETVDLNVSIAHRKRAHAQPDLKAIHSPPMLWSVELPNFYRYSAEGIAEIELSEAEDQRRMAAVLDEVRQKCGPQCLTDASGVSLEFPNEAILCPDRRVLDDPRETFKHFDRALSIYGIPKAPF